MTTISVLPRGCAVAEAAWAVARGPLTSLWLPYASQLLIHGRLSGASDVYSFGIIMFEMLTWQPPFGADEQVNVDNSVTAVCLQLSDVYSNIFST